MKINASVVFELTRPIPQNMVPIKHNLSVEISDDDILRIGKRYFELASNPANEQIDEDIIPITDGEGKKHD